MQFRFKNAPKWFCDLIYKYYIDELHSNYMAAKKSAEYDDLKLKEMAVEFFTNKGFTVWLDKNNQLCFDVDPDSARWTYEILRS